MGKVRSTVGVRPRCDGTGKMCLSADDARRAAKTLNQRNRRDRWPVHPFLCSSCGAFHTGHVPVEARRHDDR